MGDRAGSILVNSEALGVEVGEEVTTTEHFHHDVDIILVLKHIKELDNIGMLAHFQNLDFSF